MMEYSDVVALYLNKANALIKGMNSYISEMREIYPFSENGKVYVPAEFFSKSIEAQYQITDSAELMIRKRDRVFKTCNFVNRDSIIYGDIKQMCEALGLSLYVKAGLILYSENPLDVSWEDNLQELRLLCESFIYDEVTGDQIVKLVKERYPDCGHPRMIMTEERFAALREEYEKGDQCEPVYAALFRTLTKECEEILKTEISEYELRAGIRLIYVSDAVQSRCLTLALMYQITGREEYAVRARDEMLAAANFKDWHPYHFLDTGIMSCGMGLAYDWLYHWLSQEDRRVIRSAILEKAIAQIMNDYDYKTIICEDQENPLSRTCFWNHGSGGNWVFASGAGVAIGALAICDELTGRELEMARRSLSQSLIDMRPSISKFAPDGGYEEGVGYWGFSNNYWQRYVGALMTAAGSDFGYTDAPGLRQTNGFLYAVFGPAAKYAYHDVKVKNTDVPSGVLFWANRFQKYYEAAPRIKNILDGRGNYHDLLFYDPVLLEENSSENAVEAENGLDYMSVDAGIFATRNSWNQDAFWLAFHADDGVIKGCHRHSDGGSFVLQALGEEFFLDLGSDDYNLPDYRKTSYRCRAEGHNLILLNPGRGQYAPYDMQFAGKSKIGKWSSGKAVSFVKADITDLWREDLISGRRGVMLRKKERVVLVRDELLMKKPSELYWFAHTRAEIELLEGGRCAKLTLNGKTLYARILQGEGALFTVMEAKPLPTSPACPGQNENAGVSKLTIHMENVSDLQLLVGFAEEERMFELCGKALGKLDEWSSEEKE